MNQPATIFGHAKRADRRVFDFETGGVEATAIIASAAVMLVFGDGAPPEEIEVIASPYLTSQFGMMAAAVNGLTPSRMLAEGVHEHELAQKVQSLLMPRDSRSAPIIRAGYNITGFDDGVLSHTLFRNGLDPYAHTWKANKASGYEITLPGVMDVYKMVIALWSSGAEGFDWKQKENGNPSLRLGDVCEANGISADGAHDAMVDVRMTARLMDMIEERAPKYYDYMVERLATKPGALAMLNLGTPLVHLSRFYGAKSKFRDVVIPLFSKPGQKNSFICLSANKTAGAKGDLHEVLRAASVEEIAAMIEAKKSKFLRFVKANSGEQIFRLTPRMEMAKELMETYPSAIETMERIAGDLTVTEKLMRAVEQGNKPQTNGESMTRCLMDLYGQPFLSNGDRRLCEGLNGMPGPGQLHAAAVRADAPGRVYSTLLYRNVSPVVADFMNDPKVRAMHGDELRVAMKGYVMSRIAPSEFLDYVSLAQEWVGPMRDYIRATAVDDQGEEPIFEVKGETIAGFIAEAAEALSMPKNSGLDEGQLDVVDQWMSETRWRADFMNAMTELALDSEIADQARREEARNGTIATVRAMLPKTRFISDPENRDLYMTVGFIEHGLGTPGGQPGGSSEKNQNQTRYEMEEAGMRNENAHGPQASSAKLTFSQSLEDIFNDEDTVSLLDNGGITGFFGSPAPADLINQLCRLHGLKSKVLAVGAGEETPMTHFVVEVDLSASGAGNGKVYMCDGGVFKKSADVLDFCRDQLYAANSKTVNYSEANELYLASDEQTEEARKTLRQMREERVGMGPVLPKENRGKLRDLFMRKFGNLTQGDMVREIRAATPQNRDQMELAI